MTDAERREFFGSERMDYAARVREMTPELVHELVFQREMARKAKDYAAADAVREQLRAAGVVVVDAPGGPTVDLWCDWARWYAKFSTEAGAGTPDATQLS